MSRDFVHISCISSVLAAVLVVAALSPLTDLESLLQRSLLIMAMLFVTLVVLFASCQAKYLHEPLTKEAIDYINMYASWKADPSYAGYDAEHFKSLCGVPLDNEIPPRPKKLGLLKGMLFY